MAVLALALVMLTSVSSAAEAQTLTHHEALRGHQIWQLPGDVSTVALELTQKGLLDVLDPSRTSRRVRVPFQFLEEARRILQERGITHKILTEDLATFLEMEWFLKRLCDSSPRTALASIGKTNEDRDIWMVRLRFEEDPEEDSEDDAEEDPEEDAEDDPEENSKESSEEDAEEDTEEDPEEDSEDDAEEDAEEDAEDDPEEEAEEDPEDDTEAVSAVWIEAGIHAREWISSAVALHLLEKLLRDGGDVGNLDVYVVPMANPDGYEYSRLHNRLWRKNRRQTSKADCAGVDLNRNWNFHYSAGASDNECSEVFMGTEPFSEPETKALRDAMTRVKDQLKLVLCFHSYGQQLLYPWGYSASDVAPHTDALVREGKVFAEAAQNSGNTSYAVINAVAGQYVASGTTADWSEGALGVKYMYTLELRDEGEQGFLLDARDILPCSEVWAGLQALLKII